MKLAFVAAAAMAVGAGAGFAACWAANKLTGGKRAKKTQKMGVMNKVLILEAVLLMAYTIADMVIFWHTGSEPYTLTGCVFGVCGLENGVMGWIKTSKEKKAAEPSRTSQAADQSGPEPEREEPPDVGQ